MDSMANMTIRQQGKAAKATREAREFAVRHGQSNGPGKRFYENERIKVTTDMNINDVRVEIVLSASGGGGYYQSVLVVERGDVVCFREGNWIHFIEDYNDPEGAEGRARARATESATNPDRFKPIDDKEIF